MASQMQRSWTKWFLLGAALALAPRVDAQGGATGPTSPRPTTEFGEAGAAGPAVPVEARRRADLSPQDQLAEAQRIAQRAQTISRRIQSMLDQARRDKDIVRVTCLDDKLSQVNARVGMLSSRIERLESYVTSGNVEAANHEFTVVTVIDQKLRSLEQEANQCIGQDAFETGATRVEVDVEPGTPDEQPERLTLDVGDISVVVVPPPASATL